MCLIYKFFILKIYKIWVLMVPIREKKGLNFNILKLKFKNCIFFCLVVHRVFFITRPDNKYGHITLKF
jgi:hypothetical protein